MGFGTLLLTAGGRAAEMAAHVTDEVWTTAPLHEAPLPVLALERVPSSWNAVS